MSPASCWFMGHRWALDSGVCADGWIWSTNRCVRCFEWQNPLMRAAVAEHNKPVECLYCHLPLDYDEACEDGRHLHADVCVWEYDADRQAMEGDRLCDAARDAELMWRE